VADDTAVLARLRQEVRPLIEKYCLDCHDADVRKGDFDLDALTSSGGFHLDVRLWDKVEDQLLARQMPPPKKAQPSDEERKQLLQWIAEAEAAVLRRPPLDPGYRKARRLTRTEYALCVADLLNLGTDLDLAGIFPTDGAGGEGFDKNADTLSIPVLLIEKYLEAADLALTAAWQRPQALSRLVPHKPGAGRDAAAAAKANLEKLARRAFRRPVSGAEIAALLKVYHDAAKRGLGFDDAMRQACKAVLMSPHFLILQEENRPEAKQPWQISSHEMASRLSFFLWSSLPDDELSSLAEKDQLRHPAVIAAQVRRMLADRRSGAFVRHFAGQWLALDELFNTVDPDTGKYKEFTPSLRRSMHEEALRFSAAILRGNGRVLDFIDSDYTFANEELARFYGISGVTGGELRRVSLPDKRRGGVLGMGAVLAATAYPQRTSPVLRGKWVLENLMGTPAPPPPANVGSLPEDDRNLKELTFRQQLEKHRSKEQCMGCHNRLDPPGFGLENFDPIGKWRDTENGKPLDTRGNLADGRSFNGPAEMRQVLMQDKHRFVRNFCRRLLGYALERGLEAHDQPALLRLEETLVNNDYHSLPVIVAVAQSFPFTHRRSSAAGKVNGAAD
jgi:hypothetical protein